MAPLDERSKHLRNLAIDALEGGERGHIGSTMSLIEIMRVLYDSVLDLDCERPDRLNRDRLILSKGHGCIAQYVLLADLGFFQTEVLKTFCHFDSILGGHPERSHIPGIDASTGSLGHGLSIGVGMAYAAKILGNNRKVFVVVGDGELNEGSVWEAAMAAAHHALDNLTVVVDFNGFQSYGRLEDVWSLEPVTEKWTSFGFDTLEIDGHDVLELEKSLASDTPGRPKAIIARTVKGKGVDFAENQATWHHKARLNERDILNLREAVANA